jgi:hypothetical protein
VQVWELKVFGRRTLLAAKLWVLGCKGLLESEMGRGLEGGQVWRRTDGGHPSRRVGQRGSTGTLLAEGDNGMRPSLWSRWGMS